MAILVAAGFVFGMLGALIFGATPFVAGNIILAVAIIGLGLANGLGLGDVLLRTVIVSAALQAGFLLSVMRNFRSQAKRNASSAENRRGGPARTDNSTMDGSL